MPGAPGHGRSCGHSCGPACVVSSAAGGEGGTNRKRRRADTMAVNQIWRASRIRAAGGRAPTTAGRRNPSDRTGSRLWALLNAQALLSGLTCSCPAAPSRGTAGEAADIPRRAPRHHGRRPATRSVRFGRQHLRGRCPPARRRDEQFPYLPGQAERISQQHLGVLARSAVDAPLQVTDRPGTHARRLGQLLLRQPGLGPELPQQPGETHHRLRRGFHRPSPDRRGHAVHLPSLRARQGTATAGPGEPCRFTRDRSGPSRAR